MPGSRSVLVIGGGIVGLCVAYYARLRGHEVTLVDRGEPDGNGCSFGNAGMIVPSHVIPLAAPGMASLGLKMMMRPESPFYFRPGLDRETWAWAWNFYRSANAAHVARSGPLLFSLHLESHRLYEELDCTLEGFGFGRRGIVMLCRTERELHEEAEAAEWARHLGLPCEILSSEACAKLEPGLRMTVTGGIYYPEDRHLTPGRLMAALAGALNGLGVRFIRSATVTGWRTADGQVTAARTAQGDLPADAFVLAAGSWSARLARELSLRLPIAAGKGYSLTLCQPRKQVYTPAILTEARVAVTPMGSALRFAGTMEIGGLDLTVNPARVHAIQSAIPDYFPEFGPDDFRETPAWCGLRPCSPDGMPYIGSFQRYPNLYAATGHAMMGISLGPITGRLIAELLSGEPPSIDLSGLKPDRFG